MDKKELREILENTETCMEMHKNDFYLLGYFVIINDIITLREVMSIRIIESEETGTIVWFGKTSMKLENLEKLHICDAKSFI